MTGRRTVLLTAGVAALAAVAGPVAAQSTDIGGVVAFESGAVIPQGRLEISLEDRAVRDPARRRTARTHLVSDGASKVLTFSLSLPANSIASPTWQVVARLERADGWLIARGSTRVQAGSSVHVKLNAVLY